MKNSIIIIFILLTPVFGLSQFFEIRTVMNDLDYLVVEMRDTTGSNTVTPTSELVDLQFEIRWPDAQGGDVDVELICSTYPLWEGLGYKSTTGSYYWRAFSADPLGFYPPQNWDKEEWQIIAKLKVASPDNDSGTFAPAPEEWIVQGLNLNVDGTDYDVHVADSVENLPYPTLVYDYVWRGGSVIGGYDENSWTNGANWENPCGYQYSSLDKPAGVNNCVIPGGLIYYPTNFFNSSSENALRLRMQPGSQLEIPNTVTLNILKDLLTETGAKLDIKNGGKLDLKDQ